jgi:hypothetical protein
MVNHRLLASVGLSNLIRVSAIFLGTAYAASAGTLSYIGYTVTGDSITLDTPHSVGGVAGEIHLITTSGTIDAWCIDVYGTLLGSGTFNISPFGAPGLPGVPSLTSAQIGEIGALILNGDGLVASPPKGDSAADVATAIQIAIWSVEYGTTPPSGFTYDSSSVDSTVPGLASTYYADATGGTWKPLTAYSAFSYTNNLTLTSNQTLAAIVPEPPTWAMMVIGFVGLGLAGYRASHAGHRASLV